MSLKFIFSKYKGASRFHHHSANTALLLTACYLLSVKTSANEITASDKIPGEPDASSKSTFSYCYSGVHRQQLTWRIVWVNARAPPATCNRWRVTVGATAGVAALCKPHASHDSDGCVEWLLNVQIHIAMFWLHAISCLCLIINLSNSWNVTTSRNWIECNWLF